MAAEREAEDIRAFLYDEERERAEEIKRKRKFPLRNLIILIILIAMQTAAILFAVLYTPMPQDKIDLYTVKVETLSDGTLDIEYSFVWTPLDKYEELTWVEIGMANPNYSIDYSAASSNISEIEPYQDEDYVSVCIYFERSYTAGETFEFSFKVNQEDMLSKYDGEYFYEFVPCWFNSTNVEKYKFMWKRSSAVSPANADRLEGDYYVWEGEMPIGTYRTMKLGCDVTKLDSPMATRYESPYIDSYDALYEDKVGIVVMMSVISLVILYFEIYMLDSFVSYSRGRGFMRGYGHHVHVYGYRNPVYIREAQKHGSSSGGGRSGGCACACACACAGGGRAGCSQKDLTSPKLD